MTGRMAGDSHTWFPRRHSWSRGVGSAYVIAVPSLATLFTQGTLAQDRTWGTNPDAQISSEPNLGPALSSSSGQPQVPPKARGQNRPGPYPRPASPWTAASVTALAPSAPQLRYRSPGTGVLTAQEGDSRGLCQSCASSLPLAPRSARQEGASAVNSRVQPVTRAPQAPQIRCFTLSRLLAPSADPCGFLLPSLYSSQRHQPVSIRLRASAFPWLRLPECRRWKAKSSAL